MIYYVSLDNDQPSGGVKTQYRHVDILNRAQSRCVSKMLHQKPGFHPKWFNSVAPVAYMEQTEIAPGDVLVWPEILRSSITPFSGVKQLIFNQNIHYTWRGMRQNPTKYQDGIDGTMVLTEWERDKLHTFLGVDNTHPIGVVRHGIDPTLFAYDGRPKRKQIAFMPRKHGDEAEAVFGWLFQTGALKGWKVVSIDGQSEKETAETFKDSQVFFAFGYPEGGTLPPFEALAAGCQVMGYGGFASDDLLVKAGGYRIPSGDTCQFALSASLWLNGIDGLVAPELVSQRCLEMFSMKGEEEALLRFMRRMGAI